MELIGFCLRYLVSRLCSRAFSVLLLTVPPDLAANGAFVEVKLFAVSLMVRWREQVLDAVSFV